MNVSTIQKTSRPAETSLTIEQNLSRRTTRGATIVICKKILLLSACLLIAAFLDASAQQSATATLSGAVKDQNGAFVAGAQIILTQTTTKLRRKPVSKGH